MKEKKKHMLLQWRLLLICAVIPLHAKVAFADADNTLKASGYCGERESEVEECATNATYTFNEETGALVISGEGEIGFGAFGGMPSQDKDKITSITIGDGITSIDANAFKGAQYCTQVTLPKGLLSIGYSAFYNCFALQQIDLPDSLQSIGELAFYNDAISEVDIPANVRSLYLDAFGREAGDLKKLTIRSENIEMHVSSSSSYKIPSSMETAGPIGGGYDYEFAWTSAIPANAFMEINNPGGNKLRSITVPDTVSEIGDCAFFALQGMESFSFPAALTSIGRAAFEGSGIQSVDLPEGLSVIAEDAFSNCDQLTTVTIPSTVTEIGWVAFHDCDKLQTVTILSSRCNIYDSSSTFCIDYVETQPTIRGYDKSTAETFAQKYSIFPFESLGEDPNKVFIQKMDIGNVWTQLSPVQGIAYTTAFDPDGALDSMMEFTDQYWTDTDTGAQIHSGDAALPLTGHKYYFTVVIAPKSGYVFGKGDFLQFIYGGSPVEPGSYTKTLRDDGSITLTWGVTATAQAEDLGAKELETTVSGIVDKTYSKAAQTQEPVIKIKARGEWKTLQNGTDYTLAYDQNVNAGTATVTIKGKGNFTGSLTRTFAIKKAANTLSVKAKTATVKYAKLKKKTQTLSVSKILSFANKGQGKISYSKTSGNKKITINKKSGKVTVKKGLKKGTYKVKVKVKAAGDENYEASSAKTVTVKVKVK